MTVQTYSQKTARAALGLTGALALTLLTSAAPGVRAQQTSSPTPSRQMTAGGVTVRQAVNRFAYAYGTPIIQRGAINDAAQATLRLGGDGSVRTREADITALAAAAGAAWHRMFFVTPATPDKPVTTLADARALTTASGRISLQIKGLPLEAAARAFAGAAGSEVTLTDGLDTQPGGTVTIPAANLTAAQIIARMAGQTKTHWSVGYVLRPMTANELALARRSRTGSDTAAIPVTAASSSDQTAALSANQTYLPMPYQGNDLNGNPFAQVANQIPDGYDRFGNPYFNAPQGGGNGSFYQGAYPSSSYGDPYGMGGFTTTSPTYYGYGYGPGTNPYAAGVTQNATPFTNGVNTGLVNGFDPYNTTVFSSGGVGATSGPTTLTP